MTKHNTTDVIVKTITWEEIIMLKASNLIKRINDTGEIILNFSGVKFNLTIHSNYEVTRLKVLADVNDDTPRRQRIYVAETTLREIAMHMADCLDHMVYNEDYTWQLLLEKLYELLRINKEWCIKDDKGE